MAYLILRFCTAVRFTFLLRTLGDALDGGVGSPAALHDARMRATLGCLLQSPSVAVEVRLAGADRFDERVYAQAALPPARGGLPHAPRLARLQRGRQRNGRGGCP